MNILIVGRPRADQLVTRYINFGVIQLEAHEVTELMQIAKAYAEGSLMSKDEYDLLERVK